MPRFVILRHVTPPGYPRPAHYDLMLEQGDALWTWALTDLPTSGKSIEAERLRDHRVEYLDFEGDVSDGRGSVSRVDRGDYELVRQAEEEILVRLQGVSAQTLLLLNRECDTHRWRVSVSDD